jgi:hypothetical protein
MEDYVLLKLFRRVCVMKTIGEAAYLDGIGGLGDRHAINVTETSALNLYFRHINCRRRVHQTADKN